MKIGIGSDHAGFNLKEFLKAELKKEGYEIFDVGTEIIRSVDYPDYAEQIAKFLNNKRIDAGILICGTGIGMSIAANKFNGVRAARCCTINDALLARQHNNANVITLGGRITADDMALQMVKKFLNTPFLKGRHLKRLKKIKSFENS